MARIYTVEFAGTIANASGDYDLFEFDPADDRMIEVCGLELAVTSELTDAADEWLALRWIRGHATDGTGGSSVTPRPCNSVDAAAAFACDTLRTGIASAGTGVNLASFGCNVGIGYSWGIVPEGYGFFCLEADGLLVLRMTSTVADDVTCSGTAWVRELP